VGANHLDMPIGDQLKLQVTYLSVYDSIFNSSVLARPRKPTQQRGLRKPQRGSQSHSLWRVILSP